MEVGIELMPSVLLFCWSQQKKFNALGRETTKKSAAQSQHFVDVSSFSNLRYMALHAISIWYGIKMEPWKKTKKLVLTSYILVSNKWNSMTTGFTGFVKKYSYSKILHFYFILNTTCYLEIWRWFQTLNHYWTIPLRINMTIHLNSTKCEMCVSKIQLTQFCNAADSI